MSIFIGRAGGLLYVWVSLDEHTPRGHEKLHSCEFLALLTTTREHDCVTLDSCWLGGRYDMQGREGGREGERVIALVSC